jgi:hypothetical protein
MAIGSETGIFDLDEPSIAAVMGDSRQATVLSGELVLSGIAVDSEA